MKSRILITMAMAGLLVSATALAGWLHPVKATGIGPYSYTNDVPGYLSSIYVDAAVGVSNTITANLITQSGAVTNGLVNETANPMDSLIFTPDSQNSLFLEVGDVIVITDTAGQVLRTTINRNDGRAM